MTEQERETAIMRIKEDLSLREPQERQSKILGEWVAGEIWDISVMMIWSRGWMDGDDSEIITVLAGGWPVFSYSKEDWADPEGRYSFARILDQADYQSKAPLQMTAGTMWAATGAWSEEARETWMDSAAAEAMAWAITAEGNQYTMPHISMMALGALLAGWPVSDDETRNEKIKEAGDFLAS